MTSGTHCPKDAGEPAIENPALCYGETVFKRHGNIVERPLLSQINGPTNSKVDPDQRSELAVLFLLPQQRISHTWECALSLRVAKRGLMLSLVVFSVSTRLGAS